MPSRQPAKALARKYLERIEARVADGKIGDEDSTEQPPRGERMARAAWPRAGATVAHGTKTEAPTRQK